MTIPPAIPLRGAGRPVRSSLRKVVLAVLGVTFLAFVVLPWFGGFATDYLWFKEVHFEPVFITSLLWRSGLFVGGAALAFGFVYGNIRGAQHPRHSHRLVVGRNRGGVRAQGRTGSSAKKVFRGSGSGAPPGSTTGTSVRPARRTPLDRG